MRNVRPFAAGLVALPLLLSAAVFQTACKSPSIAEVQASLQVVDVQTKWVAKDYKQWPQPKLVLVPLVQFRVKNTSSQPLLYVNFNAIFKKPGDPENLGDNFLAAIRDEPIPPGGFSPVITLKSNFGREGRNLAQFKKLPQELTYNVKIFAQFGGSRHALLGEYPVSKDIDFKEDEAVHMDGKTVVKTDKTEPGRPETKR